MNGKLIGLLIRSNAAIIEAISASARLADKDGTYDENLFWGLRQEVIAMADEAEAITRDAEIQQAVSIAADKGEMHGAGNFPPMVPISPAHQLVREPLKWSDVQVGRKFAGKSANNGQHYLCVITETDVHMNLAERAVNVRTKILEIYGNEVAPFDRPIIAGQFKEEFYRWIE